LPDKIGNANVDAKTVALLSLYGLSLVWSPMFGTSEALVFPALWGHGDALLVSRVCNLAGFGISMGILSVLGARARQSRLADVLGIVAMTACCLGMLAGALTGMGILPLAWLYVGASVRGLAFGVLTVYWIEVLIHLDNRMVGAAVAAALLLYSLAGLLIVAAGRLVPPLAAALLVACPALSYMGCRRSSMIMPTKSPVNQEAVKAPFRTRCLLYGANFAFGIMLGALLLYFALYDSAPSIAAFMVAALLLLVVFRCGEEAIGVGEALRGFMMLFAVLVPIALLLGWLDGSAAVLVSSAALAVIILYTVVIFADTQARMRNPFWKVPGVCQAFASLGMIAGSCMMQTFSPAGEIDGTVLDLLAAACIIFISGVFAPNARTRLRPWGFSSLIPSESPEAHAMRRCGEIAEQYGLTSRELEVLQQLTTGNTKDEIAEALCISPTTAKTHIRNIYAKVGVHSHQDLISKVIE
jgi:DNA-binding CsgD family transcriptional regulator